MSEQHYTDAVRKMEGALVKLNSAILAAERNNPSQQSE